MNFVAKAVIALKLKASSSGGFAASRIGGTNFLLGTKKRRLSNRTGGAFASGLRFNNVANNVSWRTSR